jgi:putative tricarboxylic transport membrane protein
MKIRAPSDFWCGLLFVAIGVAFAVLAQNYRFGTAARMGPGYFPTLLGALMALLGLTLSLPAFVRDGEGLQRLPLRPFLFVLLAIAAFGLALAYLGLAAAIAALVVVGSFAEPELKPLETAGLAAFLVVFSILIFVVLLGLPIQLWPDL